ncbi:MAG: class I SAM-dependent methyltransferase, partial [Clostridiales bacterium]|nr:class I SAM-dependent methyltransferase [Clostridiales bacterium]
METSQTDPTPSAEATASAFSLSEADIDEGLRRGSGYAGGKLRIAALYENTPAPKEAQEFLKDEYGIGGHSHTYLDGTRGFVDYNARGMRFSWNGFKEGSHLRWPAVEQHIRRMVENSTYLSEAEQDQLAELRRTYADTGLPMPNARMHYPPPVPTRPEPAVDDGTDDIDPDATRESLEESGIVNGEAADEAAIAANQGNEDQPKPAESMADLSLDEPLPPSRHPQPVNPAPPPFAYDLHPGDTMYMDGRLFIVDEVRFFDVAFRDPTMTYPIYRAESKTILEPLLDRDERNWPFRTTPLQEAQEAVQADEVAEDASEVQSIAPDSATNFHITDDRLGEGGPKTKFENNIRAIRTLKTLEKEDRPASPEDQEVLSRYVGWGGIPQAFDEHNAAWADEYRELKSALTEDEYEMARASTLNAHYTSPTVIRAIYSAVEQMGFRSGNVLEPSCGVGNFFGMLPESMEGSALYGVELDSITGRIAQYLYPQADIAVTGFEKTDRKDFFDLAVGNVPFGSYKVADRQFGRYNFLIHDYFFAKALDQVRPGGIVAFITSKGTMDKQSPEVRKYIAQRAELLGAIRLPSNAFRANAGTEVTSDIIFLQKRDRAIDIEPDWVHLGQTDDGIPVNSYFAVHP